MTLSPLKLLDSDGLSGVREVAAKRVSGDRLGAHKGSEQLPPLRLTDMHP
jgi:hypothetical protein